MREQHRGRGRAVIAGVQRSRPRLADVIAGVSVAVVGIPQSLAYAELAGLPPVAGLYAGALPPIAAALFASSPYLQTGPVAMTSLLTYATLSTMATPGSPEYLGLGLALALVVGLVRLLLGLLRAGWLAYLISQPMLLGFVPAAATLIASSQIPTMVGITPPDIGNEVLEAVWGLAHPTQWSLAALAMAAATMAVILVGRRIHVLFPGVLVAAAAGVALSALGAYPEAVVGRLPSGMPPFTLLELPWQQLPALLLPGAIIALIGFSEAAAVSRRYATEERSEWSADREFVSQGVANLTAAAFGGMPCGGSFSRSSVNRLSGARTRWAGAITGLTVLAFLPFASILSDLPLAVLSGIIIVAVLGLMRFRPLLRLWRISPPQAVIAWSTLAATLLLAPRLDIAILLGIGLSLAVLLWRLFQLDIDITTHDGTLDLAPRGVLWFGTAPRLASMLPRLLAQHPTVHTLSVDLSRLGRIDTTGALALRSLRDQAHHAGLRTRIHGTPPQSQHLLDRILHTDTNPLE